MPKLIIPSRAEFRSHCFAIHNSSTYCFKFHYKDTEIEVYSDERFNLFRTLINKASNQDKVTITSSNFQFLKRLHIK